MLILIVRWHFSNWWRFFPSRKSQSRVLIPLIFDTCGMMLKPKDRMGRLQYTTDESVNLKRNVMTTSCYYFHSHAKWRRCKVNWAIWSNWSLVFAEDDGRQSRCLRTCFLVSFPRLADRTWVSKFRNGTCAHFAPHLHTNGWFNRRRQPVWAAPRFIR